MVGFLAAAALAWFAFGFPGAREPGEGDWRSAVIEYMDLYTNETFAFPTPDAQTQGVELARSARGSARRSTPATVALPGLDFKVAFILGYDGAPLAEIAYVDPSSEPVLFCILKKDGADAPLRLERRGDYALATWARAGRKFLVIGRLPDARIAEFAADPGSATVTFRD